MKPLDPEADGVWEIACRNPKPSIRILGGFTETDVLAALVWRYRNPLGAKGSPEWGEAIRECKSEWAKRFLVYPPHVGRNINEYISQNAVRIEIEGDAPLSVGLLAYFRERQRNRIHDLVLREFIKSGMTKTQLAHRMGRSLSRVTKWLGAPGNWELDTVSDFLLAISGAEIQPSLSRPFERAKRNYDRPEWLGSSQKQEDAKPDPSQLGLTGPDNPIKPQTPGQDDLANQLRFA